MKNCFKEIRQKNGYSLKDAGNLSGIHFTALSRAENGHAILNAENLLRLAQFYGCTVDDLLGASTHTIHLTLLSSEKNYNSAEHPTCKVVAQDADGKKYHLTYNVTDKAVLRDNDGIYHICARKFKPMAERGTISIEKCLSYKVIKSRPLFVWNLPDKVELNGKDITAEYMYRIAFADGFDTDTY